MLRADTEGTANVAGGTFTGAGRVAAVAVNTEARATLTGSGAGRAIWQRRLALAVDTEGAGAAVSVAGTLGATVVARTTVGTTVDNLTREATPRACAVAGGLPV